MSAKKFRAARVWSNRELQRFSPRLAGSVVNVSAWRDEDKEGRRYRDYFGGDYTITNHAGSHRGFQGDLHGELELDLSSPIEGQWLRRFDVVFCHTVLEHVYEVHTAFRNLCEMSRDAVVLVVPFLQEQHGIDYWRFTPLAIEGMFRDNGMRLAYLSANDGDGSIYLFAIGVRYAPERFAGDDWNLAGKLGDVWLGRKVIC